ncbi:unnamed protein product [Ambrosiozyma monospora]|uniref:Unnamed protein product n=1 Tax=Ambrosiozyma monospora TaxID=43982 RepID=A0A9W6STH7_AMBMO|nr:unnamed protein product [Ambrosiozyma monospora]
MLTKVIEKEYILINKALDAMSITTDTDKQNVDKIDSLTKLNYLPWQRFQVVDFNKSEPQAATVSQLPKALIGASQSEKYLAFEGGSTMTPIAADKIKFPSSLEKTEDGLYVLDNGKLKATINKNGVVVSLIDLVNNRQVIDTKNEKVPGGNQFVMFSDTPLNFQAWDTELYSLGKYKLVGESTKVEILESGPLVSSLKIEHALSKTSVITTIISLDAVNDCQLFKNTQVMKLNLVSPKDQLISTQVGMLLNLNVVVINLLIIQTSTMVFPF